jgi:uncharacterized membrane protein
MSTYDTKPTIENVLERIDALRVDMQAGFKEVFRRLDNIEARLDRLERHQSSQDARLDAFIEQVIELKRDLKHPV